MFEQPIKRRRKRQKLPKVVEDTLNSLKIKYGENLTVGRVRDNFYVSAYNVIVNPITKIRDMTKMEYVGSISPKGKFSPAKRRKMENFEAYNKEFKKLQIQNFISENEAKVLRNLSMNSRMPITEIAKQVGVTNATAASMIKRLTERLNINYFAYLNLKSLGYLRYLILFKFINKKPSLDEIKEAFENDPRVLLVATIKGSYDLMVYFCLESDKQVMTFVYKWLSEKLQKYKARKYVVPFSPVYGSVPVREPFFNLLKERIWHRTREQPRKLSWQLTESEFKILRDLAMDGNIQFKELALRNGLSAPAVSYIFEKLKQRKIINYMTLNMNNIPLKYYVVFVIKILDFDTYYKHDREGLIKEELDYKYPWINKYSFVADIGTPVGEIYIAPILNEDDYQTYEQIFKYFKSIEITSWLITDVIIGSFANRNFDNIYALGYKVLVEEYKFKPKSENTATQQVQVILPEIIPPITKQETTNNK